MKLLSILLGLLVGLAPADELGELKVKLGDKYKWTRKDAVEGLAALGTEDAWELVVDALDDPAGEVADTAQWELGGVTGEEGVELLLGKRGLGAKDEWVRLRVAEALGRVADPVEARVFQKALGDKDPMVRRALAASIARRGAEGLAGEIEKLVAALVRQASKDRDPRAAGEAWMALAILRPAAARELWEAAKPAKMSPAALCAVLRSADALALDVARIATLGAHREVSVRVDAAEALARRGTAASARALVELLYAEEAERPAWRLVGLLRGLSGLKHRRDARPWRAWAEALPEDWSPTPADATSEDDEERSVALAGLPIRSGRIAILIDLSGSMWKERDDGKTRKQAVDEQLERCLTSLPETTRFNLIPYTHEPLPWKKGLVDATPKNAKAAAKWFADIGDQRKPGNFWGAYVEALADPEVDTVIMLGDCEPTGGPRYVLGLLPDVVAHENLGRAVAIDSIIVGSRARRTHEAWARIADESGGTSIVVDL